MRSVVLAVLALALWAGQSAGQVTAAAPLDFSFGPQEGGHLGALLKGDRFYTLSRISADSWDPARRALLSPFAGMEVDAGWSSEPDALNNASLSFKPAFGLSRIGRRVIENPITQEPDTVPTTAGPWLYGYADLRQRWGRIRAAEGGAPEAVNQTMLGGGAELRWVGFNRAYADLLGSLGLDTGREDQPPWLGLTYYTVQTTYTEAAELPDGILADALQATLRFDATLPLLCTGEAAAPPAARDDPFADVAGTVRTCPFGVTGELTRTWPRGAGGELFRDVGIYMNTGSNLKPVLRFRSGEEHGLSYDRQLLLGILWSLSSNEE